MKSKFKKSMMVLVAGSMMQLGGCFGPILQDAALSAAYEFIWDGGLFDFFGDSAPGIFGGEAGT